MVGFSLSLATFGDLATHIVCSAALWEPSIRSCSPTAGETLRLHPIPSVMVSIASRICLHSHISRLGIWCENAVPSDLVPHLRSRASCPSWRPHSDLPVGIGTIRLLLASQGASPSPGDWLHSAGHGCCSSPSGATPSWRHRRGGGPFLPMPIAPTYAR